MKNIILCSDGTGNTTIKGRGTNVFKLYEAVDVVGHTLDSNLKEQIAFYDDGVGTDSLYVLKVLGGTAGLGLSRNVRQLYTELCKCYQPSDEIYLFGFSRGAFTVRTLAGLIWDCGIIDQSKWQSDEDLAILVKAAWKAHRRHYRAWIGRNLLFFLKSGSEVSREFRDKNAISHADHPEGRGPVQFIGVWDTVAAVGLPFDYLTQVINSVIYRFSFPDLKLGPLVKRACHAISIDDERHTFHPLLWEERKDSGYSRLPDAPNEKQKDENRIEQVWFSGVHSNVGGGYPKQGMSLVSLDWMMDKAEKRGEGIRFIDDLRRQYRARQNIHDKLYDSRAGLAVYYRYKPRDIMKICKDCGVIPKIHESTFDRIHRGTQGYAPINLPHNLSIVSTVSDEKVDKVESTPSDKLAEKVNTAIRNQKDELNGAQPWIWIRRYSHYAFLFVSLFAAWKLYEYQPSLAGTVSNAAGYSGKVGALIGPSSSISSLLTEKLLGLIQTDLLFVVLLSILIGVYIVGRWASSKIKNIYSRFWRKLFKSGS